MRSVLELIQLSSDFDTDRSEQRRQLVYEDNNNKFEALASAPHIHVGEAIRLIFAKIAQK